MNAKMMQFVVAVVLGFFANVLQAQIVIPVPPSTPTTGDSGTFVDRNGNGVPPVIVNGAECDGRNYCRGLSNCMPSPILANGAAPPCPFQKTVSAILVGNCNPTIGAQCMTPPNGGGIICMVMEYRAPSTPATTNNCQNSCGQWEYILGGACK